MRRMVPLVVSVCAWSVFMLAWTPPVEARAHAPAVSTSGDRVSLSVAGGPELVLEPHPGAGAVCAVVAVPAGSAFETSATRGVSHLIEHMVFDGAERYSRVEMSGWVDDVGGFLNAYTRTETTVYFLLVSSRHAEKGIEILSQMLLHSLFLPEELEKERKVITEEIRREADDPQSSRSRVVERSLYRGSPIAEPVTGSPSTIEAMSRDEVLRFYRAHYAPSGMRVILMGDFDPAEAMVWVEDYFAGAAARGGGRVSDTAGGRMPDTGRGAVLDAGRARGRGLEHSLEPRWRNEIDDITDAKLEPGFDMLIPFPSADEKDFPVALLLSTMLGGPQSPLPPAFEAEGLPAPELSIDLHRGFSVLRVHVGAAGAAKMPPAAPVGLSRNSMKAAHPDSAHPASARYENVPAILEALALWRPTEEMVAGARVSFSSGEMFDREMYHLYVMSRGEGMGLFGERYIDACTGGIDGVSASDCARLLRQIFGRLRFNACLTTAEAAVGEDAPGVAPAVVEVFPNGITAAALARPGSPVAALHLLVRGRNCAEAGQPRGLAEVLGTLLKTSRAGAELEKQLEAIGARVQFGDNPYVPFDDYLLSPAYSFIRLESPAASSDRAIGLLVKTLLDRDFTADDLDAAKKALAREVGMRSGSPMFALRGAIYRGIFGTHPFGAPIFPSPAALGSLTLDELKGFAERYLRGGNVIATLVSSEEPKRALGKLRDLLAAFPSGSIEPCPPLPVSAPSDSLEMPTKKEGAYLAASWLVPANDLSESASILIAAEVLSRRMQLEIREKLGLAYSTDCAVSLVPGGAVVYAYVGTGAARLGEAERALEKEIRGLAERLPDAAEAAIAKNRLIGKRTRSELSSINEAYSLGLDMFLGDNRGQTERGGVVAARSVERGGAADVSSVERAGGADVRSMERGAADVRSMETLIASVPTEGVTKLIGSVLVFDRALSVKLVPGQAAGRPPAMR